MIAVSPLKESRFRMTLRAMRPLLFACAILFLCSPALAQAQDIVAYGQECARKVAPVPAFDCLNSAIGAIAPITVDEKTPPSYQPQMLCDRPSLLYEAGENTDGQCVPYSRFLVLRDDATAQIAAVCRQKKIRGQNSPLFDEVDIVAHNVQTGSTCWFQAQAPEPLDPGRGLNGRRVPPPDEAVPPPGQPSARSFWNSPEKTASATCVSCHDIDPFMYSPLAAQTRQLPSDPFGKYANNIGAPFQLWPKPLNLSTRGNTCTSCHRIGSLETCQRTMRESTGLITSPGSDDWAQRYPNSHWMPPGNAKTQTQWDVIFGPSLQELLACCANPKLPQCIVAPVVGAAAPLRSERKKSK
jgi:hypothetical protein